jgi:hypothetical protein
MSKPPNPGSTGSRYKNWIINLLILAAATIIVLALAETALRWLDGYQFSSLKLNQDNAVATPAEQRIEQNYGQ